MPLRIGIAGKRGTSVIHGLRACSDVELTAMCDVDEETLNRETANHGIRLAFTDFGEMLDHIDAVIVATPMQFHAGQSIQALKAGKHVLSEVTACVSLSECQELVDAAESGDAVYMMAENYCYGRDNVLIRELVREGLFGELYFAEGEYLHDVKSLHHFPDGSPTWRSFWQVGQNGNTYPTHSLGPLMQWFKTADPKERATTVVCMGTGRHTDPEHPHDDTSITLVQLASGKLIRLRLDMMSNRPHLVNYYSLQGTQGCYEASRIQGEAGWIWLGENPPPGPVGDIERPWRRLTEFEEHLPYEWRFPSEAALAAGHGGGDYFVARDFVEAAQGRRPNPIDVRTAVEWTAVGLCSQISINEGGRPVQVPDFRRSASSDV